LTPATALPFPGWTGPVHPENSPEAVEQVAIGARSSSLHNRQTAFLFENDGVARTRKARVPPGRRSFSDRRLSAAAATVLPSAEGTDRFSTGSNGQRHAQPAGAVPKTPAMSGGPSIPGDTPLPGRHTPPEPRLDTRFNATGPVDGRADSNYSRTKVTSEMACG